MIRRRKKRAVAISKLAAYAANPDEFERLAGAPRSPRAAAFGERWHNELGKRKPSMRWLVILAILLATIAVVVFGGVP